MRWIFFSLALCNLLVFAWGMVVTSGNDREAAVTKKLRDPYGRYPELVLLSELGERGARQLGAANIERQNTAGSAIAASGAGAMRATTKEAEDRLLCELVGPFESNNDAGDFVQRLAAIEVSSSVKEIELSAGAGYWVYLEPAPSRREALRKLRELQARKIDSYVIPRGELANGISLGMFSKKSLSEARVSEMRAIGLTPKVEEIERSYRELWVMLHPGEGLKMSDLSWRRAMEDINMLERRQNYCLDVASQ